MNRPSCIQYITEPAKNLYNNTDIGVLYALIPVVLTVAGLYECLLFLATTSDILGIALVIELIVLISTISAIGITNEIEDGRLVKELSRIILVILTVYLIRIMIIDIYVIIAGLHMTSHTTNTVGLFVHFGVYVMAVFMIIGLSLIYICKHICATRDSYDEYSTPILSKNFTTRPDDYQTV